jgi:hypothetical protein
LIAIVEAEGELTMRWVDNETGGQTLTLEYIIIFIAKLKDQKMEFSKLN